MKPDANQNGRVEQSNNQQSRRDDQSANPPQAASKVGLEQVKETAAQADENAHVAHKRLDSVKEEMEELREENEELRSLLERTVAAVRHVDTHLTLVEKGQAGAFTNGKYESENIAEMARLPEVEELETVDGV